MNEVTEAAVQEYLHLVELTLPRIAAMTAGVDEARLHEPPAPDEWSVMQIFAHLRANDEVWTPPIYAMLALDTPTLPEISPRQWMRITRYETQPFQTSFRIFDLRRGDLLDVLHDLSLDDWSRSALIGKRTFSVFSQVRRMAQHEDTHCQEIAAALKQG